VRQPHSFLKTTAVVSSVTLVGLYIIFEAGGGLLPSSKSGRAWHLQRESNQPIAPEDTSGAQMPSVPRTEQPAPTHSVSGISPSSFDFKPPLEMREQPLMSSSKSMRVFEPVNYAPLDPAHNPFIDPSTTLPSINLSDTIPKTDAAKP
jgi:hypothetical protein